ncbi:MAG: carbon storage regulator CsrA [Desulfobacterales bacterium]|nr:carbon storage regulator CsrA [Desulfobacterales bacterium]
MLILTRRPQEAIMVGDDVTVTVLSIKGNQVRLGIDAPRDVDVHREEIYHKVKEGVPHTPQPHVTNSEDPQGGNKIKTTVIRTKSRSYPEDDENRGNH